MRITIIGAGGIGGYLAAKLAAADRPVTLVARGATLEALRRDGLRLIEPDSETVVHPTLTDAPGEGGPADLIVLAVKAHQVAPALDQIAPAVGTGTAILPFQNGVDAPDQIAGRYGRARTLIGVARILSNITAPGVVTRYGDFARFVIGAASGRQDDGAVPAVRQAFAAAGIAVPDVADARVELWRKFVLFNALSSVTAAGRMRFGHVRAHPETRALAETLMREVEALAHAEGVDLPTDVVAATMAYLAEVPAEGHTSTAHDLTQGRPLEIAHLCEAVVRRSHARGIAAPASATISGLLAPFRDGPPPAP